MGVFDLEWIIGALIKLSIKQSLLLHPSSIGEGSGHQSLCGTLLIRCYSSMVLKELSNAPV